MCVWCVCRGGCRPGFRGKQHLASCEPQPDVCWPDIGQAPLGGGCTGGSHNPLVQPNPDLLLWHMCTINSITMLKKVLKKERRGKSKALRVVSRPLTYFLGWGEPRDSPAEHGILGLPMPVFVRSGEWCWERWLPPAERNTESSKLWTQPERTFWLCLKG